MAFTPNVQGSRVIGSLSGITSISSVILSASTYIGLPTDIRVTGGTYSSGIATFINNTGGTFTVTGFSTGTSSTDTYVTGGTYSNGTATFTNNSGGTFTVSGFKTSDIFVTGSTYSNNEFIFTNNTGGTFNVLFNTVTGLTSTGLINTSTISATTYENLPIDINVTGGTYSNGDILFINNTGGTFTVSGLYTGYTTPIDVRVTGGTYSNGTAVFTNNTGGTFNVTGFKNDDTFVTGGTYSNGDILFTNNTGGTFNVSGLYTGYTAPIDIFTTGGTFSNSTGIATFTNNSGGTFNVNGFFKTSDDIYTTGITFNPSTYDLSIGRNDNTSFTQNLAILATDMTITGGTYNGSTGVATFTNNTGGTFSVSGFLTGMTDTYTTGFTYSDNTLTLKRNAGQPDLSVLIDAMTGLTVNGTISTTAISATTYYNLPTDITITGGTYSNGTTTFTNNTGGTFTVSGFKTSDLVVTGGTYNSGSILFTNNTGGTFTVTGFKTDDLVVTGGTYSSGTAIFTNNTGGTFSVSGFKTDDIYTTGMTFNPSNYDLSITRNDGTSFTQSLAILASDMTVTGGTYNSSTGVATFTNNTGGTFNVSGFLTGMTDTYTTGFTYSDNTLTLKRNAGQPDLSVMINSMTGLTVNGTISATTISATTYLNLPTDIRVTGGTYSNNTFTFTNNTGGTFSTLFNTLTGVTVNGDVLISGSSLPNGFALSVTGDTNFTGNVYVTGDLTYNGNLLVTGGTVIQSGLTASTIYTDYIDFNTNYTGATLPAGRLQWDDGNGTLVLGLKGGVSNMEIGLENMALCYNAEATTLTAGTVVYVSGSQGNRPSIKRAIATSDGYSVTTLGVVSESIASGAEGFVTTFGMVNNLNTIGYTGGTPIWLSPTVAGGYTTVKPQAPYHTVLIGYVVRVNATVGSVFVHVSNGWEIDELHDVRLNGRTQGDLLTLSGYNGSNVWVNSKTLNGSYTITGNTTIGGNLTTTTISATTYLNLPTDVRVTGGTYSNSTGVATFTNNTGGTFNVNGFFKPTDDIYTTGMTFNNGTYDLSIERNDGTSFSQSLAILASDMTVTGGTYNGSTGVATFTNNSGGTFNVSGFLTGMTDTYTTGVTFNNNILTIQRNAGQPDINTLINNFSGLTVNGTISATTISATTYQNLPPDLWTQNGTSIYYNTGNVGIGESNPTRKFEVLDGTGLAYFNLTGTSGPVVAVSTTDYTKLARFSATDGSTSILFGMRTSGETANPGFGAQNDTYIYANSNANGLNIINAAGTSKGDYIRLYAGEVANSSIAHLHVQGSGSTKGFIGINTENPIARLHVSGNTLISGNLSATTISATTYQNLPPDLWTQNGTSIYYNTGKVGIGITNPTREFEVVANTETFYTDLTNVDGVAASISSTDLSKRVRFGAINSGSSVSIGQIGTTATGSTGYGSQGDSYLFSSTAANNLNIITQSGIGTEDNIKFFAGNIATATPSMIIVGSGATKGFVGIGTASPTNTLQIHGNPTASIRLQETGSGGNKRLDLSIDASAVARISANQSAQSIAFDTVNSERMRITSTGNVGIGTTVPSTKLHVSGNTLISGDLTTTTISATTYLNLPTDIRVTGGTHSSGVTTFTNNTGGTFTVSGFSTGNTTLYLYAESSTIPSVSPIVNGTNSIALGGNAEALANDMFVYGQYAGNGTTGATNSNLIGYYTGYQASDSGYSNFIGRLAGFQVSSATSSNLIGRNAGERATGVTTSNFIGFETGKQSSGITTSNFSGYRAGYQATGVTSSNFIGNIAGYQTSDTANSNFIGSTAGYLASGSSLSNFIGNNAGRETSNSIQSNFIGTSAGYGANSSQYSNFTGHLAGAFATGSSYSNFIGYYAGYQANDSTTSNFIGWVAGQGANNFTNSNFIGYAAGYLASGSSQSNFIGFETGRQSSGNTTTNFFGYRAGYFSINNPSGLFMGSTAGYGATGATSSNFIGNQAGYQSNNSTFSNFFGFQAGYSATSTSYSNFIGFQAGRDTTGATFSNLIGYYAGETFAGNNIGSNNIVIGTNISLPNAATNSINIGGVLFGTNTYSTTTGNPSITPTSTGRIGIGIVTPSERLHVSGNTLITGNLNVSGNTNVRGLTGTSATISGTGQNILTVIGSGNSTSSPLFSVQGSSGELFSVTDSLTGSLFSVNDISGLPIVEVFSDNTMLVGSYQAPALNTTVKTILTAGTNTIYSIPTSAYTGSFIDYTVISSGATGARAGTIMSIWSGTTAQYTDVSTNDIGTTAGITFSVSVVGNNAVLSSSATTAGWTLKTIIRSI